MPESVLINGKKFITSKEAASLTGYARDYVGQLVRMGKVEGKVVEKVLFVNKDSLLAHVALKNSNTKIVETSFKSALAAKLASAVEVKKNVSTLVYNKNEGSNFLPKISKIQIKKVVTAPAPKKLVSKYAKVSPVKEVAARVAPYADALGKVGSYAIKHAIGFAILFAVLTTSYASIQTPDLFFSRVSEIISNSSRQNAITSDTDAHVASVFSPFNSFAQKINHNVNEFFGIGGEGTTIVQLPSKVQIATTTVVKEIVRDIGTTTVVQYITARPTITAVPTRDSVLATEFQNYKAFQQNQLEGIFDSIRRGRSTSSTGGDTINNYNATGTTTLTNLTVENTSTSTIPTLNITSSFALNGDVITDFVGSGLEVSNGVLSATAGTGFSTTSANYHFDNRLAATTTLNNLTTLRGLTDIIATNATVTTLAIGSDYITDLTGSGLVVTNGALTVSGASGFSTTSADFWETTQSRWSTSSDSLAFDTRLAATTTLNNLTTLRGLTDLISTRATTTNATSTNFFATTASTTNLFVGGSASIGTSSQSASLSIERADGLNVLYMGRAGAGAASMGISFAGGVPTLTPTIGALNIASQLTDSSIKTLRLTFAHYNAVTSGQICAVVGGTDATSNSVGIGGGSAGCNSATNVALYTASDTTTTTGTVGFVLNNLQNVGIGTQTPTARLNVQGRSGSTTDIFTVASSTGAELFIVKSTGNVGVGTSTPTQAFSVNGNVWITGNATSSTFTATSTTATSTLPLLSTNALSLNGTYVTSLWSTTTDSLAFDTRLAATTTLNNLTKIGTQSSFAFTNATGSSLYLTSLNCTTFNNGGKITTDSSGQLVCANDQTGSGGSGGGTDVNWTFFNNSGISVSTTSNQVVIGASATSTSQKLEVTGGIYLNGSLGIGTTTPSYPLSVNGNAFVTGQVIASYFSATSTNATSTLPSLSTTNLAVGSDYITDLTGTGLSIVNGVLTATNEGTWATTSDSYAFDTRLAATTTLNNITTLLGLTDLISTRATTTNATSTSLYVTTLGVGSDYITDLTGTNLSIVNGALTAADLTFSTTSADYWETTQTRWATTSDSYAFDTRLAATTTLNNIFNLGGLASVGSTTGTTTFLGAAIFNGNVGIGTTTPASKLVVTDTASFYTPTHPNSHTDIVGGRNIRIYRSSTEKTGDPGLFIYSDATTTASFAWDDELLSGLGIGVDPNSPGAQKISLNNGVTIGTTTYANILPPEFGLLVQGSVGLGTTSPYAKLSVVGQTVAEYFTATSTTATSTLPLISTNAISINGQYFTSFWSTTTDSLAFDTRLAATTTLNNITTLGSLSLPLTQTTGTLSVARGGTGQTSFGQGWLASDGTTITSSTSPTVAYLTATSTTATSTLPLLSVNALSFNGNYVTSIVGGTGEENRLAIWNSSNTLSSENSVAWDDLNSTLVLPTINATNSASILQLASTTILRADNSLGNFFAGQDAGISTAAGSYNTGVGQNALQDLTTGAANTALGQGALTAITEGSYNIGFGYNALSTLLTGSSNVVLGSSALPSFSSGDDNIVIGSSAGNTLTTGSRNILIGSLADITDSISNSVAIGYNSRVTASNSFILGNNVNVGIGTTSPYAKLSVVGQTVSEYFTATSTTATSTFNGGAIFNGNVGIGTSTANSKLTLAGGNFTHTAAGNPTLAGTYNTSGNAYNVHVSGKYAYVADDTAGLQIIDISNPAAPTLTSTYDTSGQAVSVQVSGKYAYVADYTAGLQIIDISNPKTPSLTGTYNTTGNAYDVYVSGKYAYVADNASGLHIIDISNPAAPTLTGTYNTSGTAYAVYVSGKYAYVADDSAGLQIIDISNPSTPTLTNTYNTTGFAQDVYVSGKYAYVADSTAGLQIIDISNPAVPSLASTLDTSGFAYGVHGSGKYVYVADYGSGLHVVDVSNPASPTLTGTYDTSGSALIVYISGKYAYVADFGSGLQIIDINGIETPSLYAGNINTNALTVTENADIGNSLYVRSGLNVGQGGIFTDGALTVAATSTASYFGGAVGIGTTSPYAQLSVTGTTTASTTFALRPVASQTANIFDLYSTTGTLTSVITAAGNWGIGTTSPYQRLSVNGSAVVTADILASIFTATSTTATSTLPLLSTNAIAINGQYFTSFWSTTTDSLAFDTRLAATSTLNNLNILGGLATIGSTTGTTTIAGGAIFNGNVGIGTTTPTEKLTISGKLKIVDETIETTSITFEGTTAAGLKLSNSDGYISLTPINSSWAHIYSDRSNFIFNKPVWSIGGVFSSYYGGDLTLQTGGSARMTVANAGSVGIGDTVPDALFDIASSTATMMFRVDDSGDGDTTPFVIDGDGNVGIGTTSPYAKLSVVGQTVAEYFTATSTTATSTFPKLTSTYINLGSDTLSDFTGTGILNVGGALTLDTSAAGLWATTSDTYAFGTLLAATTTLPNLNSLTGLATIGSTTGTTTIAGGAIFNGNVGIGTTATQGRLHVGGVYDTASDYVSDTNMLSVLNVNTPTTVGSVNSIRGILNIHDGVGNSSATFGSVEGAVSTDTLNTRNYTGRLRGGYLQVWHDGSGTVNEMIGTYTRSVVDTTGGPVTTARGIKAGVEHRGAYTLGTATGIQIYSATKTNPVGVLTNNYGLYIENQSVGVNNYAIYSAGGQSYFAGNLGLGTTSPYAKLSVVGQTVAEYFTATSTTATSTFPLLSTNALSLNGQYVTSFWSTTSDAYAFGALLSATTSLPNLNSLTGLATIGSTTGTTTLAGAAIFNGNIGIGTSTANSKLTLAGGNFTHTAAGNPTLVGTYNTSGSAGRVYISGKYAYVADSTSGLQIIDISNPSAPTLTGTYNTSGYAVGVYVAGKYAYVADDSAGLRIIDVSNPASPTLVGTRDTSGVATNVYVSGKYAYVADGYNGMEIINISNPASPTLVGTYDTSALDDAVDVYVSGKYAYVSVETVGLHVVDISNPASPTLVGTYDTSESSLSVYASGKYVYVSDYLSGLQIIDISNPSAPTLTGAYDTSGYGYGLYVAGKYAYIADGVSGLQVIDISNPSVPMLVGTYDTSGDGGDVYISGKYAYVGDGSAGLQIIDINGIETPSLYAGNINTNALTATENIDVGNNLYVRNGLNVGQGGIFTDGFLTVAGTSSSSYFAGIVGIGTTTPSANLAVNPTAGTALNQFVVGSSTGTSLIVNNSGYVGIGTANPIYALDVTANSSASNIIRVNASAGNGNSSFVANRTLTSNSSSVHFSTNGTTDWITGMPYATLGTSGSDYNIADGSGNIRFLINKTTGNVGIGTTSPLAKLDVTQAASSFSIVGGADVSADSRTNATRKIFRLGMPHYTNTEEYVSMITGDSDGTDNYVNIGGGTTVGNAATKIVFKTGATNNVLDGSTRMLIDSSGNVGIGTTSPLAKFTVSGGNIEIGTTTGSTVGNITVNGRRILNTYTVNNGSSDQSNLFFGLDAGNYTLSSSNGQNSSLGYQTLNGLTTGIQNSVVGFRAGTTISSGSLNSGLGGSSCRGITTGSYNTCMGASTGYFGVNGGAQIATANYTTSVGYGAYTSRSNAMVLGGLAADYADVVIGTSTPFARLGIQGFYGSTTPLFDIASTTSSSFATSSLFRVNYDGNVGIGTMTPGKLLDVAGVVRVDTYLNDGKITGKVGDVGGLELFGGSDYNLGAGIVLRGASRATEADTIRFTRGAYVTSMLIDNQGNVGIGTTSPYAKLSVAGQVVGQYFTATSTTATSTFPILESTRINVATNLSIGTTSLSEALVVGDTAVIGNELSILALGSQTDAGIYFGNDTNTGLFAPALDNLAVTTGGTERLRIDSLGDIGIGSTSPFARLSVDTNDLTSSIPAFSVGSSTKTDFMINGVNGNISIGTTTSNRGKIEITHPLATPVMNIDGSASGADVFRFYRSVANGGSGSYGMALKIQTSNPSFVFRSGLTSSSEGTILNAITHHSTVGGMVFSTSTAVTLTNTGIEPMYIKNTSSNVGIAGTSTPWGSLSVNGVYQEAGEPTFVVGSSTRTDLVVHQSGFVGIGTTSPWRTFSTNGSVAMNGLTTAAGTPSSICMNTTTKEVTVNAATSCVVSDRDQKQNIQDLSVSGLDAIKAIKTVTFAYNDIPGRSRIGFIAQDLQAVDNRLGDAFDKNGIARSIDIPAIMSVTVKAVQELDTKVDSNNIFVQSFASSTEKALNEQKNKPLSLTFDNGFKFEINQATSTEKYLQINSSTGADVITFDEAGNVGIGDTTPDYKLQVAGDIAATAFVNVSTRDSKKDITYLDDEEKMDVLKKLGTMKIAQYRYKLEDPENPLRLGLIAEEAPAEVLSASGKGVDIYKLSTFTLSAVQAQQKKISDLEIRLSALEAQVASSTPAIPSDMLASFMDGMKNIFTDTLTVGSATKPSGITLFDEKTGEPYCIKVVNGEMKSTAGKCTVVKIEEPTEIVDKPTETEEVSTTTATTTPSAPEVKEEPKAEEPTASSTPASSSTPSNPDPKPVEETPAPAVEAPVVEAPKVEEAPKEEVKSEEPKVEEKKEEPKQEESKPAESAPASSESSSVDTN